MESLRGSQALFARSPLACLKVTPVETLSFQVSFYLHFEKENYLLLNQPDKSGEGV